MNAADKKVELNQQAQKLIDDADKIAAHVYAKLAELPEEEKWNLASKLRQNAVDTLWSVAEAWGDGFAAGSEKSWLGVRSAAAGLRALYRFAGRQNYYVIDPDIMLALDRLLEQSTAQAEFIAQLEDKNAFVTQEPHA